MEMQPITNTNNNNNNHLLLHHQNQHQHLPFLPESYPSTTMTTSPPDFDFDSAFSGVSLQSLLLGEPLLLTPPPPPLIFPPPPLTSTTTTFLPLPPATTTFFFQASGTTAPSEKKRRCCPRRNRSTPASAAAEEAVPRPRTRPPRKPTQKVSEKLKALRRIVPCDQKADIATMLEQAYRYVRYLEAQVLVLLTMKLCPPLEDLRGLGGGGGGRVGGGCGESEMERWMVEDVGRLSREEVVEAVVNSGAAQRVMYEEGLCLVSEEQVRVLCLSAFQKQQQQQLSGFIGVGAANLGSNNNNNSSSCCSFSYN